MPHDNPQDLPSRLPQSARHSALPPFTPAVRAAPADMVWVPGGTFRMGSDDCYPEERPVHP